MHHTSRKLSVKYWEVLINRCDLICTSVRFCKKLYVHCGFLRFWIPDLGGS